MDPILSIAIPVYNQNPSELVADLQDQITRLKKDVEILLFDDGSEESIRIKNRSVFTAANIRYEEIGSNIGRAAIRNRLARAARSAHILFLDGDSLVAQPDFLHNYIDGYLSHPGSVICGGRYYQESPPGTEFSLHWTYGVQRESKTAEERARKPHVGFHSNNFLIPKSIWELAPFDEALKQYGHEDTLLGFVLLQKAIPVIHLENATIHGTLETNEEFLKKTCLALENLKLLYNRGNEEFNQWHGMLQRYGRMKSRGMLPLIRQIFKLRNNTWRLQFLEGQQISLRRFDYYRFGYFCSL